ncbi:MAG TPA: succinyl-diaminopimelate desuccinylase [Stellaceae bacterium]|nr:succinyl-diaminopimelate desuccinylase [Stellaceae bacterium]
MSGVLDPIILAGDLIRRPSVTPRDEGTLPYLAGVLESLGFTCHLQEFSEPGTEPVLNLYARVGTSGRNFCFAGHTDVVPPGDRAAWSQDPFSGAVVNEALWGRGSSDMKGAIACFAAAAAQFLEARGSSFGGSLSLLITGDEEGVSINGTAKLLAWLEARGERIDACIVGEPTSARTLGDMVKIGRRGSLNGILTVHGTPGHIAYPHLADNAAHRLVMMLHALTATELDEGSAHFQASTLQISTIDIGNPATNVIPGTAKAVFNIRFNDHWTSAGLHEWLDRRLSQVGGRFELDIKVSGESFLVPPHELAALVSEAVREVTGKAPELSTTGGTSDARFIHRYAPVAELGLVGLTMHKVDEHVPLADMTSLTQIYRRLLDRYFPA